MRCGEMIALEWSDVDLANRQLSVRRSDWNGHVTVPKGGRIRHVPMTRRLATALSEHRHLRSTRVLCQDDATPLTRQIVQTRAKRAARRAGVSDKRWRRRAHPSTHGLLAPGDAWRTGARDPGARRTSGPVDDSTLHASEPGGSRRRDSVVGGTCRGDGNEASQVRLKPDTTYEAGLY